MIIGVLKAMQRPSFRKTLQNYCFFTNNQCSISEKNWNRPQKVYFFMLLFAAMIEPDNRHNKNGKKYHTKDNTKAVHSD